ncbi:MAG: hypothetical protein JWO08_784 [Verrucomicrobiaceae bacterium]|nr:hypothetical protein [Verrucomicrobiaceae bacterium]
MIVNVVTRTASALFASGEETPELPSSPLSVPEKRDQLVGFKEWANVCEALGTGVMSLILRKGGIHEGHGGFEFKHQGFFLFPTWFHTQGDKLTWQAPDPERFVFPPEDGRTSVDIDYYARLEKVWRVTEWDKMLALAPYHVWNEDMVRERFIYDQESCLNVALVRAYKLPERWSFPYSKSYGGCRSWVNLPEPPAGWRESLRPAVSDETFASTQAAVSALLD